MIHDPLPDEPFTDIGYANRLAALAGGDFRYIPVWNQWRHWDGKRWAGDELGRIQERVKQLGRDMHEMVEAEEVTEESKNAHKALLKEARHYESAAGVSSVIKLAATHPAFARMPKDFDSNPMLLNMPNGVYDLASHEVIPHSPDLMLSKVTIGSYLGDVAYRNGHGKLFKTFLSRVQPDPLYRQFLSRLVGCMLEGRVTEQMLVIFHGAGANGKSTFNETIDFTLGNYATAADSSLLSDPDQHPAAIANLVGRRVVLTNELGQFNESRVKLLTSQDTLQARRMREDFWTFSPSHNIIAATNDMPRVGGTSDGIWRRIQLVPWDVRLPRSEWDRDLSLKLRRDADWILSWLLRGYRSYTERGLGIPSGVQRVNENLRADLDPVSAWIRDCCTEGPKLECESSTLWDNFEKWHKKTEFRNVTRTAFGRALGNKGYRKGRNAMGVIWTGLTAK